MTAGPETAAPLVDLEDLGFGEGAHLLVERALENPAPVSIRMTRDQAARLQRDWFYGHARFEEHEHEQVRMIFGESDPEVVFALLRWLGPGAELIAPSGWRAAFAEEVRAMLAPYE